MFSLNIADDAGYEDFDLAYLWKITPKRCVEYCNVTPGCERAIWETTTASNAWTHCYLRPYHDGTGYIPKAGRVPVGGHKVWSSAHRIWSWWCWGSHVSLIQDERDIYWHIKYGIRPIFALLVLGRIPLKIAMFNSKVAYQASWPHNRSHLSLRTEYSISFFSSSSFSIVCTTTRSDGTWTDRIMSVTSI